MSQAENMALPMEGQISRSELLEIKNTMNTRLLPKEEGVQPSADSECSVCFCCAASIALCSKHCIYAVQRTFYNRIEYSSTASYME